MKNGETIKSKIVYSIAARENAFFWWDPWHPMGLLRDNANAAGLRISASKRLLTVSSYIVNDSWIACPNPKIQVMKEIWDGLQQINRPSGIREDMVLWRRNQILTPSFIANQVWNTVRVCKPKVEWSQSVWYSCNIPRHAFMVWRGSLNALTTADQLAIKRIMKNYCLPHVLLMLVS
ncbi:hypothetical protein NE237_024882 [Protea cynaroides]|uniref:Reverse transcriptase zinc-binding domain-containing protein n=1 Tax=Protea cynaroides TaxID=273540 RepID=A0A9Q0H0R0_9MAGN|nr:hypothetical protein NE237_024882 [Protea cynaroides]